MMHEETILQSDQEQRFRSGVFGGCAALASYRSPTRTTGNEDCAAILPYSEACGILAIADGLGGERAGAMASRVAIESLREAMYDGREANRDLRDVVLSGIELANRRILSLGTGAATTLAVALVEDGMVRTYHVGDSWLAVIGQRGKLKRQSIAHSPVGMAMEAGVLSEVDAMHHEERHIVSNVVGSAEMRVEIGTPVKLAPRDTLVLASDGVTDNLFLAELVELTRKGPLETALTRVVQQVRRRMLSPMPGEPSKPDDMSLILFRRMSARRRCQQS